MVSDYQHQRQKMVDEQLLARGIKDPRLLEVMRKVPRHLFVEEDLRDEAYEDRPLPIGRGQTISQPYMVAMMTEAIELKGNEKALEIGTGSGYQTAVLAELTAHVYTIERLPDLQVRARNVLETLGYNNISYKTYNGTLGWPEEQPFHVIVVTAGAPQIPRPLFDQLVDGGRMIIPVGDQYGQEIVRIVKKGEEMTEKSLGGCTFVPLRGEFGW